MPQALTGARNAVVPLVCLGTLAGPLAFGATTVGGYCALQALAALAALCWIAGRPECLDGWWLPVAVVALGLTQMAPLPPAVGKVVSPLSFAARDEARALVPLSPAGPATVDAMRTFAGMRRVLTPALLVVIVANAARSARDRRRLLVCVGAVGAMILTLGLVVGAGPDGRTMGLLDRSGFWKHYKNPLLTGFTGEGAGYADEVVAAGVTYIADSPIVGRALGALTNANHFAACIGLTLPATLWLWWGIGGSLGLPRRSMQAALLAYGALALAGVGIAAGSRGGLIALGLTALCVGGVVLSERRRAAIWWGAALAGVGLAAALLVTWSGAWDRTAGRGNAWRAAVEMFAASPWLGVGLGNYATVFPRLRPGTAVAHLAHNAWLETAAEAGLAGLTVTVVAIVWIARRAAAGITSVRTDEPRARRLALLAGALFAVFHGALDLSVQVPANAWLCAVLIGLLVARPNADQPVERTLPPRPLARRPRGGAAVALALCAAVLVLGGWREWRADRLAYPLRRAVARQRLPDRQLPPTDKRNELLAAREDAERALSLLPADARIADALGQAALHLARQDGADDLREAEQWFSRSLALCPVSPWTRATLLELRMPFEERPTAQRERARQERLEQKARQRRPPRGPQRAREKETTNVPPDRSAP